MALSGSRTKTAWCSTKKAVEKAAASDEVKRKEVAGDMAEKGFDAFNPLGTQKEKEKTKRVLVCHCHSQRRQDKNKA